MAVNPIIENPLGIEVEPFFRHVPAEGFKIEIILTGQFCGKVSSTREYDCPERVLSEMVKQAEAFKQYLEKRK